MESLKDVAQKENLPAWLAEPWKLPATAVWSNQGPAQKEGTPAMAPANTADPKQIAPAAKQPRKEVRNRKEQEWLTQHTRRRCRPTWALRSS